MGAKHTPTEPCPLCGGQAVLVQEERPVRVGRRRVTILDERWACPSCQEEFYTPAQAETHTQRAAAAIRAEDALLSPDQIRAVRESLGLTQEQFEKLLGVGPKSVVRWERGTVAPNKATDRLLRLVAVSQENVRILAALNGFVLEHPPNALGAA